MRRARALLGLLSLLWEGNCIGGGGGGGMTKKILERHYFLRLQKPFSTKELTCHGTGEAGGKFIEFVV